MISATERDIQQGRVERCSLILNVYSKLQVVLLDPMGANYVVQGDTDPKGYPSIAVLIAL